jgi:FlaG/FlaF family flagellin (archaellin)
MLNNRNDTAVSEVAGSILMVAVTVILAALIGVTALSFFGTMQPTRIVGVTAVRFNESNVTITYYGCDKPDQLYWLNISVNGARSESMGDVGGTTPLGVGNTTMVSAPAYGKDHLVVVGSFVDGRGQVVLDTFV